MEDQGDRNLAVTNKSSLPAIHVVDGPPELYFDSLKRHAMVLQSPMTIFETSPPPSPKLEPLSLIITTAIPSHLQWLNLNVDENSTHVHAPAGFTEILQKIQISEQLRSSLGSRSTITEVILRTFQSADSMGLDMGRQGHCRKFLL